MVNKEKLSNNWFIENNIPSVCCYSSQPKDARYDISITIPTYKRNDLLLETLQSVLHQTEKSLEYEIVINDNYNDKNHIEETIKMLKLLNSNRIKYFVNQENVGLYGNWNMCIQNAQCNIVALLHDDDLIFEDYLEKTKKIIAFLNANNRWAYVKSNYISFKNTDELIYVRPEGDLSLCEYTKRDLFLSLGDGDLGAPSCGSLFNRDVIMRIGGYDERFYPSSDTLLPTKILWHGYKIFFVNSIMGGYRIFDNESSKVETLMETLERDKELIRFISSFSFIAKIFGALFGKARIEFVRRWAVQRLSTEIVRMNPKLSFRYCSGIRYLIYLKVNYIRKNIKKKIYI